MGWLRISRQAPSLGGLIERAFEFLRQRTQDPAVAAEFIPVLDEAVQKAGFDPAKLRGQYVTPFDTWSEKADIVNALWNCYSDLLDIRIKKQPNDFILWEAIDVRAAFADYHPPAATHLCIAILVMEGAVKTIASANWVGYIEDAVFRLSDRGLMKPTQHPNCDQQS